MVRDTLQPPVQRRFKSDNNVLLPSFSDVAEENSTPLRRVLRAVLMKRNVATTGTYNGPESKCKNLGQFDQANEARHLCWTVRLLWRPEAGFIQIFVIAYKRKVDIKTTEG